MFKRNIAVIIISAVVLGAGAYAWAQGEPADPAVQNTADTPASDHARPFHRRDWHPLRHAYHGDLDLWLNGDTHEVTFDRGRLVEADDESVTIEYPSGETAEFEITDGTRIRGGGDEGALVEDEPTLVLSDDSGTRAVLQRQADEEPGAAHR